METITHRTVAVNGINMHIAEKGEGPVVLFLHGFPELWYSWRHQILSLAARGYHAVAPDLRGFGDSDAPPSTSSYTSLHVIGDLIALIELLGQDKVFVVGHDWGAFMAWSLCNLRPDKVKALVILGVPFMARHPNESPLDMIRAIYGEDHYMCRFQEPGIEAEFATVGTSMLLKKFITYSKPEAIIVPKEKGFEGALDTGIKLPPWLSEEDISYCAGKFEKSGFTGGLNYYRCMNLTWELTAPWTGVPVTTPAKYIVGDLDLAYHTPPGIQNYIHNGGFNKNVPFLQDVVVMEGAGHFMNQEKPHEISEHIYEFIQKF